MSRKLFNALVIIGLLAGFVFVVPASGYPIDGPEDGPSTPEDQVVPLPGGARALGDKVKAIDQPNIKDYLRNMERQRLLEAGQEAEAAALAQTGTDRVLVLLVEFTGTDVVTWTVGDTWDPLGIADTSEDTGTLGDCSNIITQTTVFTYTGPMHNEMPRPLSLDDRSGDTIWTEDFSPEWFEDFMFDGGVVFSYTMQDGTPVFEDFTGQSVAEYYSDLSSGVYTVTGDLVGWLPIDHSTWWYDADQCPGARSTSDRPSRGVLPGGSNARGLVRDAVDKVNEKIGLGQLPGFDWADYDQDGDGVIDRLWIVHAGYGEEDSTTLLNRTEYGEAAVWSHSSSVAPCYVVDDGGTPGDPNDDICAGPYIVMPENGGIGVFAHEYAHNLGADDLYAYGAGETSAGFWTLMSDDWTGYPIGFEPPSVDPWHLENWGWLDPYVVPGAPAPSSVGAYEVVLGQASDFESNTYSGPETVYRAAKIELPDQQLALPVSAWSGDYYWYGGKKDLANAMMTSAYSLTISTGPTATLSFEMSYDIEDEWDFLWIQVSDDNGASWDTLTNDNTQCVHDTGWIGGLYGFPEDLCGAGLGGFYGYHPTPALQEFDLTPYIGSDVLLRFWFMTDWGTTYDGVFVDNVKVYSTDGVDTTELFSDNAEAGDANWVYQDPWIRSDGFAQTTHNFYLQWRNTNANGGYDSALGDERWRFGAANTGLVTWYNNNFYTDNEVYNYLFDSPSIGPKGRMLVVDSHPEPYRDPWMVEYGYDNEGGDITTRMQMRDAPFTLKDTVDFTVKPTYVQEPADFSGRMPEFAFHDALGYYPGAEFTSRGPAYSPASADKWITKQWDTSAVVPSTVDYALKAPGYVGQGLGGLSEFRFRCTPYVGGVNDGYLGCYWFGGGVGLGNVYGYPYYGGNGNPADVDGQYGWHVELLEEAADHTWAKVRIWNSPYAVDSWVTPDKAAVLPGDIVNYDVMFRGSGSSFNFMGCVPLDTAHYEYVVGSASAGVTPLTSCPVSPYAPLEYANSPDAIGALAIMDAEFDPGEEVSISFQVKTKPGVPGGIKLVPKSYNNMSGMYTSYLSPAVGYYPLYYPLIGR